MWNGKYEGKLAFNTLRPDGYLSGGIFNRTYLTHRIVWLYMFGVFPVHVDHINGVKIDNSILNLRNVTHTDNMKNRKTPINNKSGHIGISYIVRAKKWSAQIRLQGVSKHLGYFETLKEAVTARALAEHINNFHPNHGRG